MVRLMTAARLGIVALLALVIVSATGTFSFSDVSAAGRAGVSRMPALFKDNGNGNNGNNGNGNGNAGQDADDEGDTADDGDGPEQKGKKAKKDKHDKSDKAKDQADDAAEDSEDDDEDGNASGNFDCDDVEGMIDYLKGRNMNGAIHANENGADNAAAGALNKCMEHEPENGDDSDDGTPVAEDGTPVAVDGTPVGEDDADEDNDDKPVTVNVEIDEDGNGVIEYDLDGDGEVDLTMIVEDGKVTSIVEAGADDGTPEASPEAA